MLANQSHMAGRLVLSWLYFYFNGVVSDCKTAIRKMSLQLAINVLTVYMHYGWSPQKTRSQATAPLQGAHLMIWWSSLRSAQLAIDPILVVPFWARLLANIFRIWHQSVTPTLHTSPLGSSPSVRLASLTPKHSNSDHIAPTQMSDKRQYILTSLEIGIPPFIFFCTRKEMTVNLKTKLQKCLHLINSGNPTEPYFFPQNCYLLVAWTLPLSKLLLNGE